MLFFSTIADLPGEGLQWGEGLQYNTWTNVRGANVIALASASAAWTKTLTLAIIFKPLKIELSYFICVLLMTRPFTWCNNF